MKITLKGEKTRPTFELQPLSAVVVCVNAEGIFGVTFKSAGGFPGEESRALSEVEPVWLKEAKLVSPHVQSAKFTGSIELDPENEHVLLITPKSNMHEYIFVPKESAVA